MWLGTPLHDHGHVKSVGVDCLWFIVCCYQAAAVFGDMASAVPPYVAQWAMHRSEEDYIEGLLKYCAEVERPERADVALFRFGRSKWFKELDRFAGIPFREESRQSKIGNQQSAIPRSYPPTPAFRDDAEVRPPGAGMMAMGRREKAA